MMLSLQKRETKNQSGMIPVSLFTGSEVMRRRSRLRGR